MTPLLTDSLLPAVETSLQKTLLDSIGSEYTELSHMLAYHMGWEGPGAGPKAQGKRLRPMLLLLSAIAAGEDWQNFLGLASAVELVHNFSLIHDDIEDNSPLRRGRETVWKRWGIPQALNAGDLMFTIAHHAVLQTSPLLGDLTALEASRLLHQTCIRLTQGQYLDMSFEGREDVSTAEYLAMISGKTAALFGCCMELGVVRADPAIRKGMKEYGICLGMAFQVQDDLLGLWGDAALTGKSVDSDLVSRKKTYPILLALQEDEAFRSRWLNAPITAAEAPQIAGRLKQNGFFERTHAMVEDYTGQAVEYLRSTGLDNETVNRLAEIADGLIVRNN